MGRRRREQRAGFFWGATEEIRRRGWVERTLNIPLMSVTLEVLKVSAWLNTVASANILPMFVTLDVSKVSGWLNAFAPCRVECRAYNMRSEACGPGGGRAWAGGSTRASCTARGAGREGWGV